VDSFYLGETEVTQGQWYAVMGSNPSKFKTGDENMPVEQVSWDDAQRFISRLNSREGTSKYALPSEEQWEYAARAGTTTKWYSGDSESCVSSIAVYNTSSPRSVKSKKPNRWGLYDMSGNVWEWTDSCWTSDYNSGQDCSRRSFRGGSWSSYAGGIRSAFRNINAPDDRDYNLGFRLLRTK
jgi:formylglycine-generating enzyme required for sulfatase activity